MDQKKIGEFLKELRKQKNITQEQLAEKFNVSSRTVSRWETGSNMPDLDILIEISDFYEIDLREILNGERKSENMNKEMKETVLQAVDYSNMEAEKCNKKTRICIATAMLLFLFYILIKDTDMYADLNLVRIIADCAEGFALGLLIAGFLMLSRYGAKIRAFRNRLFK